MRILTVRQPWAWAIIHGQKSVENRPRNIAGGYRGPVAIHAGLAYDKGSHERSRTLREAQDRAAVAAGAEVFAGGYLWDFDAPDPRKQWSVGGSIVGVVDLVDVHRHGITVQKQPGGPFEEVSCSPWAIPGDHHLVLANPRPLAEPIPYKGALGLRRLDPETILAITRQIGRTA